MAGSRLWGPDDRTGGPLDDIVASVRERFPDAAVSRMVGTYSGDDDNVYWVQRSGTEVQIETGTDGAPPFIVESDTPDTRLDTEDANVAEERVNRLLDAAGAD
jgi:hypothetical protein